MSRKIIYIVGQKINDLTYNGKDITSVMPCGKKYTSSEFICTCGNTFRTSMNNVKTGHTNSCGCYNKERMKATKTHGQCANEYSTSIYSAWVSMKERCYNKKLKGYPNYGGRGITVCPRWLNSFENFYSDMGDKPSPKHSLDRFPNNDGNYEPSNCRWATRKEQANNRRLYPQKVFVSYAGKQYSLKSLCKEFGINYQNIIYRLKSKWSIEEAISTPNRHYKKRYTNKLNLKQCPE